MKIPSFEQLGHWLMLVPFLHTVAAFPFIAEAVNETLIERRAESFYLRILPLGASIVAGWGSSTGSGFRKPLRDQLRKDGWNVNMVGSKDGYTNAPATGKPMADNSVEATPGNRVDQTQVDLQRSIKYAPNLVLINAGVNDCSQNYDVANIAARMNSLLDDVFKIDGVTVILSTLIPSLDSDATACHAVVNPQYRSIVATRSAQNQKIELAEMDPTQSSYWNTVLGGDYYDTVHPTDSGHAKMASIFYEAFKSAYAKGWLVPPAVTSFDDASTTTNTCAKVYGNSESTKTQTQSGSGWDDGIYVHHGDPQGERFYSGDWPGQNQHFYFAGLQDASYANDDIIQYSEETSGGKRKYYLYEWIDGGKWKGTPIEFWIPDTCIARGVRWADMNGDGLEDFVCIAPNGDAVLSVNRGNLNFENLGIVKPAEALQKYIRLGDIDGDGRSDYCALNDDGSMRCWRNGGLKDVSDNWQAMGVVFKERDFGDIAGVRLVDINGDGRADYLWVDDEGQTWTYTNNRGCIKGEIGQGLTPTWRAGANRENGAGPTMIGIGYPGVRDMIMFGRTYANEGPQAFGFLPSRDYVFFEELPFLKTNRRTDVSPTVEKRADIFTYDYRVKIWKNQGLGGGKLKGDGDRYCNMMGHANGRQDYVWIWSNGKMWIWEALNAFPPEPKYWGADYLMWDITASRSMDRRDLTLADWDGDGACDIIYADPVQGHVEVWLNQIKNTGKLEFSQVSGEAAPGVSCDQPRGRGQFDVAVRFADVTGNGRPDYLCMEKDGRTKGFLHNGDGTFTWQSQIKQSDGYDRANLRFADVDGDGLADLLWTDKFKGDAMVWKNMGPIPAAGTASSFTWANQGFLYNAPAQGTCLQFPDLDGNGRADMVYIDAVPNTATTWFNNCPGSGGDDADTLTSAALPPAPSPAASDPGDVYPWVALGDSFSAGPGAGGPFGDYPDECYRSAGSYPAQLNLDWPNKPEWGRNGMQFLSCTGAVVNDMIATQIPEVDEYQMVITLSIGGNDVGFGKILKACVFKPGGPISADCDQTIEATRNFVDDAENGLSPTLRRGWDAIWDRVKNPYGVDDNIRMFTQLYPSFFKENTEWCNDQSMGIIPGWRPVLDQALRHKLNRLGEEVNDAIKTTMNRYIQERGDWVFNRMYVMDEFDNMVYPGHRFCEEGKETLDDEDIWFFTINGNDSPTVTAQDLLAQYDPNTCYTDPKYDTNFVFGWYCDSARYAAGPGASDTDFRTYAPESIVKAFHPKTAAFTVIKNNHKEAISRIAVPPGILDQSTAPQPRDRSTWTISAANETRDYPQ